MAPWIEASSKSALSLGTIKELPRAHGETVIKQLIEEFQVLSSKCYPECGNIFDGTPMFSEAEAIKFTPVTYNFEIVEFLSRVALFEKKLNADNLVGHFLETILMRLGLKLDNWIKTQQDRSSTNKLSIKN